MQQRRQGGLHWHVLKRVRVRNKSRMRACVGGCARAPPHLLEELWRELWQRARQHVVGHVEHVQAPERQEHLRERAAEPVLADSEQRQVL